MAPEDLDTRCRQAIAPIVAQFLSTPSEERNETAFAKLIVAALGELDALSENAYEYVDQVRACIISSMTDARDVTPETAIVAALKREGFVELN